MNELTFQWPPFVWPCSAALSTAAPTGSHDVNHQPGVTRQQRPHLDNQTIWHIMDHTQTVVLWGNIWYSDMWVWSMSNFLRSLTYVQRLSVQPHYIITHPIMLCMAPPIKVASIMRFYAAATRLGVEPSVYKTIVRCSTSCAIMPPLSQLQLW